MSQKYESPAAFKQALEHRLKVATPTSLPVARARQLAVFDRFLARIAIVFGDAATIKGGIALELRLDRARTTKDIDLRLVGTSDGLLERLQQAGRVDLDDFLSFEIDKDRHRSTIEAEGLKYDGFRFRAEARLAGKLYGQRFGVDVAFGDPMLGSPETVVAGDLFGFAGIPPPTLRLYPIETHIAEKLHAYTLPRDRPNSRVKDLPDIALLGTIRSIEAARLRAAIEQTFTFRKTHDRPKALPAAPSEWRGPYASMAADDSLPWKSLDDVLEAARMFIDPVLSDEARIGVWVPNARRWER